MYIDTLHGILVTCSRVTWDGLYRSFLPVARVRRNLSKTYWKRYHVTDCMFMYKYTAIVYEYVNMCTDIIMPLFFPHKGVDANATDLTGLPLLSLAAGSGHLDCL